MEILLRKASSLVRAASTAASKIELESTIKISSHVFGAGADVAPALLLSSTSVMERISTVIDLQFTVAELRTQIGLANTKKVNALLSEKQLLDSQEKTITGVLDSLPKAATRRNRYDLDDGSTLRLPHDAVAISSALKSIHTQAAKSTTGTMANIEVPALSDVAVKTLEGQLASIKRRRLDLMDELAAANLQEKIKLSDTAMRVLRKHGIIE